jgi:general secretion pathway protein G
MRSYKSAFTVIELIFVIVVLGILASVALPKFTKTKEMADLGKGRSDVATIRSAIVNERQKRIIKGDNSWISTLSENSTTLFTGDGVHTLLTYGVTAKTASGYWRTTDNGAPYTHYVFRVGDIDCAMTYDSNDGTFDLDDGQDETCNGLVK